VYANVRYVGIEIVIRTVDECMRRISGINDGNVVSTKETRLIERISDVVRPERGTDFVA